METSVGASERPDFKPDEIWAACRVTNPRAFPLLLQHVFVEELELLHASLYLPEIQSRHVEIAARRVLRAVHEELQPLEDQRLYHRVASELWVTAGLARDALADRVGLAQAKKVQLEVTEGRPLAICAGDSMYEVNLVGRKSVIPTTFIKYGCGRVFLDSPRATARMFARWCAGCNDKGMSRRYRDSVRREAKKESLETVRTELQQRTRMTSGLA